MCQENNDDDIADTKENVNESNIEKEEDKNILDSDTDKAKKEFDENRYSQCLEWFQNNVNIVPSTETGYHLVTITTFEKTKDMELEEENDFEDDKKNLQFKTMTNMIVKMKSIKKHFMFQFKQ